MLTEQRDLLDYPWSEADSVDIHLPTGFELDHADAPPTFEIAPIKYVNKISIEKTSNTLVYRRNFVIGADKLLGFDAQNYKTVKAVFDQVHSNDEHMITLKERDPNAPAPATGATTQKQ